MRLRMLDASMRWCRRRPPSATFKLLFVSQFHRFCFYHPDPLFEDRHDRPFRHSELSQSFIACVSIGPVTWAVTPMPLRFPTSKGPSVSPFSNHSIYWRRHHLPRLSFVGDPFSDLHWTRGSWPHSGFCHASGCCASF